MKLQHRGMMTLLVALAACALPGCLYAGDKPELAKLPVPKTIKASCAQDDTAAKPEMDTAAAEKFKTLSPKVIVVKTGEERYLGVYEFAYAKLEQAIGHLKSREHSKCSYDLDGFLHYMNQLKEHAFQDELEQLYGIKEKIWRDLLHDSRSVSCKIPLRQVLPQKVIDLIPGPNEFFRKYVLDMAKKLNIEADIRSWDVNRLEVEMQLSGRGEMRWSDGRFTKAEIVTDRCLPDSGQEDAELRRVWMNGGVTRRCRATLILTYSMKDGDAVLKVPFEFLIWREADGAEGFKDVKVDVENAFVLSRANESAARI